MEGSSICKNFFAILQVTDRVLSAACTGSSAEGMQYPSVSGEIYFGECIMKRVQGKVFLLPVAVAVLVACGGGDNKTTDTQSDKVTLTGIVAKGVVSGAKVSVLTATAERTVLESGITTDANGRYTVVLNRQTGPVVIEADLTGATIQSETGEPYQGVSGDTLRAVVVPAATAIEVTANITPFSEMAVNLVEESGWESEAVTDANSIVRQLLGNVDHLTAPPTTGVMLTQLTSVQQLVDDSSLADVLNDLRSAAEVVDDKVSIKPEIAESLTQACKDAGAAAAVNGCDVAFVEPQDIPIGAGNLIDPVHSLFQDLRDTLLAYNNQEKTGDLNQAGRKLNDAVEAATAPVDDEMLGLLGMFNKGDQLYRDFKAGNTTEQLISSGYSYGKVYTYYPDGSEVPDGDMPRYQCEIARATEVLKDEGLDVSDYTWDVTAANANVFACFGYGTVGALYPGWDGVGSYWHQVTFIPQDNGSYKYVHELLKEPFDLRNSTGGPTRVKAAYGNLNVTRDASSDLTGFTLNGKLVPGLMGHTADEYATLDRVDATLTMNVTEPTTSSVKLDLSGLMTLYKTGDVFASSVEIASGSMVDTKTDIPYTYTDYQFGGSGCPIGYSAQVGSTAPNLWCMRTVTDTRSEISALNLDVTVKAPGVKFQGLVSAGTPSFDKTETVYVPTKTSFQGKIFEADGTGYRLLLDGKVSVELLNYASFDAGSGADVPMKMAFDGKVLIKNRPEMGLALNGSETAAGAQSLSGTFFWNSKALKFEALSEGGVTVSNDAGVRFTIPKHGGNVAQDVFQGDVKVGTVNIGERRIEFTDGRYQQF
jgi:hypothetical protein